MTTFAISVEIWVSEQHEYSENQRCSYRRRRTSLKIKKILPERWAGCRGDRKYDFGNSELIIALFREFANLF